MKSTVKKSTSNVTLVSRIWMWYLLPVFGLLAGCMPPSSFSISNIANFTDLAGPDVRALPGTEIIFPGSPDLQAIHDIHGDRLTYKWNMGDGDLSRPATILQGQPGVEHSYETHNSYTVTLSIIQGDQLLVSDTLEVSTYRLYSDAEVQAMNDKLSEAHELALNKAPMGKGVGYALQVLAELEINPLELEQVGGVIGDCINYSHYRLSESYTMLVNEDSCLAQYVEIQSLDDPNAASLWWETPAPPDN